MKSKLAPCKARAGLILGEGLARFGESVGGIACGIHTLLRGCKAIGG